MGCTSSDTKRTFNVDRAVRSAYTTYNVDLVFYPCLWSDIYLKEKHRTVTRAVTYFAREAKIRIYLDLINIIEKYYTGVPIKQEIKISLNKRIFLFF